MSTQIPNNELLDFFKALADARRLKMVGLLANEHLTLSELAERLDLQPGETANHLSALENHGLVIREGNAYHLASKSLEQKARAVLAQSRPKVDSAQFEGDAYDRKVLTDYLKPDGALKAIPMQQKKLLVVLRHLLKNFQPGVRYSEKQVNEILFRYHEDFASLRRYFVDFKMMAREKGEYWVVNQQ